MMANNLRLKLNIPLGVVNVCIKNYFGQVELELFNVETARYCFGLSIKRLKLLNNFSGKNCLLEQGDCDGLRLNAMMKQPNAAATA